jgi:saccharopepsin
LRATALDLLSEDTLHLGGINITHQQFGAADNIARWPFPPFWGWEDGSWDGILGLAHSNQRSQLGLLNPLQNMKEQNLLDKNIFSLKLPRGEKEPGEILFGDVDKDLFVGKLKSLSVVNDPILYPRLKGSWAVPATSISIGNGTASLEGYVATLESDFPVIGLPGEYVMLLFKYLGMEQKAHQEPPSIDCVRRAELEDLTVTLGKHQFNITPWEYTMEIEFEAWGGKRCMTALYPMPDFSTNYIALGAAFLKRFYSVFDLDENTVSCKLTLVLFNFPET